MAGNRCRCVQVVSIFAFFAQVLPHPALAGTLSVVVQEVGCSISAPASGTRVQLYRVVGSTWTPIQSLNGSIVQFQNLSAGSYSIEAYHNETFWGEEFWASDGPFTITTSGSDTRLLCRRYPWINGEVQLRNMSVSGNPLISAGASIPTGTVVRPEVLVKNDLGQSLQCTVTVALDRSQGGSYDYLQDSQTLSVTGGGSRTFILPTRTITETGAWHRSARLRTQLLNGNVTLTDSQGWSSAFQAVPPPIANLIISQVTGTSSAYNIGDSITATARMTNIGTLASRSFLDLHYYLGTADGSNKTVRDIEQGTCVLSIAPNGGFCDDEINFPGWMIPGSVPDGSYRVWVLADSNNEEAESDEGDNWGSSAAFTIAAPTPPDIRVSVSGVTVSDGGDYPFGSTPLGTPLSRTFTIHNDGGQALNLGFITRGPDDPNAFSHCCLSSASIAPGHTATLTVSFLASSPGSFNSELSITSNDPDSESNYTIRMSGTAVPPLPPDIRVTVSGVTIADGETYSFGSTPVGSPVSRTFTIHNDGGQTLTLGFIVRGPDNPDAFSHCCLSGASIAPGLTATLTVAFLANSPGSFNSELSITSNDPDSESNYTIRMTGTAEMQPLALAPYTDALDHPGGVGVSSGPLHVASDTMIVKYHIHNPNPIVVEACLGCSIHLGDGQYEDLTPWLDSPENDQVVNVLPGTSFYVRGFVIPSTAYAGPYTVRGSIRPVPGNSCDFVQDPWDSGDDVENLRIRRDTFGVTVITHGLQPQVFGKDEWVQNMAEAIVTRAGGGVVYRYDPDTGAWDRIFDPDSLGAEVVLIFNWVSESDCVGNGENVGATEAAAEALYAALRDPTGDLRTDLDGESLLDQRIHFIGHSRGTSVNSEVIQRLGARAGKTIDQVTTLDPHPTVQGQECIPCTDVGSDPTPRTWRNVEWADNYYQSDHYPRGMSLINAANWNLSERLSPGPFQSGDCTPANIDNDCNNHVVVHGWYHVTIDLSANAECDDTRNDWFTGTSDALGTGTGYAYSAIVGGMATRPTIPPPQDRPDPSSENIPAVFNGDFQLAQNVMTGWAYHGGGQPYESTNWESESGTVFARVGLRDLFQQDRRWLRHNRLYIEPSWDTLRLKLRVSSISTNDTFSILLQPSNPDDATTQPLYILQNQVVLDLGEEGVWQPVAYPLPEGTAGHTWTLEFRVDQGGIALDGAVDIDDITFEAGASEPSIASIQADPDPIRQGSILTLRAFGVTDPDGIGGVPERVVYYRDSNGNQQFNAGIDPEVCQDSDPLVGEWMCAIAANFPTGLNYFFARAQDADGLWSNVVMDCVMVRPPCPADINGNDFVDFPDLVALIHAYGNCGENLVEDINHNGCVDFGDLTALLASYGTECP